MAACTLCLYVCVHVCECASLHVAVGVKVVIREEGAVGYGETEGELGGNSFSHESFMSISMCMCVCGGVFIAI